jgi:hypothetical protein
MSYVTFELDPILHKKDQTTDASHWTKPELTSKPLKEGTWHYQPWGNAPT